jgi:signal transduction histidine kinase
VIFHQGNHLIHWMGTLVRTAGLGCLFHAASSHAAGMPEALASVAAIRNLPPQEAAAGLPVRLRGGVTWRSNLGFVIQDDTAGIYVMMNLARERGLWQGDDATFARLRPGMTVELEGVTDRGGFSVPILPRVLRIVGEQALPPARPMERSRFFAGAEDCQRLAVRGVVQGFRIGPGEVTLIMNANPGQFMASAPVAAIPDPVGLVDAEVCLTGVSLAYFNPRGEFLMPILSINGAADLRIEKPPVSGPFEAPEVSLENIGQFRSEPLDAHRLRVEGTVTYAAPGNVLFLENGVTGIRVKMRGSDPLQVGDRVQVAGFLDESQKNRSLTEAVVRATGGRAKVPPVDIQPEEILDIYATWSTANLIGNRGDFDRRLIRFEARLVESLDSVPGQHDLVLATDRSILLASLATANPRALENLRNGSKLMVTGIAQLVFDPEPFPSGIPDHPRVEVLLRGPADIAVIAVPSWWTPQRLGVALGCAGLAVASALTWGWQLRRRVTRQLGVISASLRGEAVSTERNRLARDLHDTLEQQLVGVAMQLDGAKKALRTSPDLASAAMDIASRMLRHTRLEARRSVWDLRSQVLESHGLGMALRTMAEGVSSSQGPVVEVQVIGENRALPTGVDFQLLRVAQEALTNALKHANASRIRILLEMTPDLTLLSIRDDGQGFAAPSATHSNEMHFGLLGIQERAIRIGAELSIVGAPGAGCRVELTLSHPPHMNS